MMSNLPQLVVELVEIPNVNILENFFDNSLSGHIDNVLQFISQVRLPI